MPERVDDRVTRLAWSLFALVAGAMALLAILEWTDALVSGRPVLYGEGAVAHAAILMRDGSAYRDASGAVAANYPPLYLVISGTGDPFRTGRGLTMASALAVAAVVWWRARGAGPLARVALALGWLALAPVAIWGAAVKPDLFAVALTAVGVALLERSVDAGTVVGPKASEPLPVARVARVWSWTTVAGAVLAVAVWAKPTALLPAAAVLAWLALRDRMAFARALGGAVAVALVTGADALVLGAADVWRHVIVWNALPWSVEQTVLVLVLGAATLGVLVALAVLVGAVRRIALAYVGGAFAVALLAGREGATINYLLDLAAATSFALATVATRLRASGALPVAGLVQAGLVLLAIAVGLLTPFGIVPGRAPTTGAWGQPERAEVVRALGSGDHLVEDSGLLVADGRSPVVDDIFLWSRLVRLGLIDPGPLVERVRRGELASVVSEADLSRLDAAPAYERARWHPDLVRAVLDRYALERSTGVLWVYRPR